MTTRRIALGGVAAAFAATPWIAPAQPAARKARVAYLNAAERNDGSMRNMVDPLRLGLLLLGADEVMQ